MVTTESLTKSSPTSYLLIPLSAIRIPSTTFLSTAAIILWFGNEPWARWFLNQIRRNQSLAVFNPYLSFAISGRCLSPSIVTNHLYSWAESTKLLPPEQSRFRKKRLVNNRHFQLTQIVAQQFARRRTQHVGVIFLDVEKAFDRVWHNGLRYNLLNLNLPLFFPGGFQIFLRTGWCRHLSRVPHPWTS